MITTTVGMGEDAVANWMLDLLHMVLFSNSLMAILFWKISVLNTLPYPVSSGDSCCCEMAKMLRCEAE